MGNETKRFSVIIPTYNRRGLLKQALDSIITQDYSRGKFEIIVVNDGSSDGTKEYLRSFSDTDRGIDIKVINTDRNYGVAHSRNLAIKNSSGSIIASIDDDCMADKNWLKTLEGIYSSKPEVMSVGVELVNASPDNIFARYVHGFHVYAMNTGFIPPENPGDIEKKFDTPEDDCSVHGCGAAHNSYRKTVFEQTGLFDERFASAEDIEFNIRFQKHFKDGMYLTKKSHIKHYYKTNYLSVLKQFFNYGRGGYYFRKIRSKMLGDKGFWYPRVYTIRFIIAISVHTKRNNFELMPLLFTALTTHASLLFGEAWQTVKEKTLVKH